MCYWHDNSTLGYLWVHFHLWDEQGCRQGLAVYPIWISELPPHSFAITYVLLP